uniref:Apolipoprotein N-acyltransferase n=1 Tax=Roseihalotalea indica TaxID=2867963 RepID=A0AA49JFJ7_9BACT|nr:apolipoprotein N-acyltransferase [Tunicatimonas sp. TK19036]
MRKKPYYLLLLSVASGLLFWLGWPPFVVPFFLFFAIAPLLAIEEHCTKERYKRPGRVFFGYTYLTLLIWNLFTTWWVYNATLIGAIFMLLANALLMTLPWLLYRFTKRWAGSTWGLFGLVLYWMTFEYIHLNWDLSWPWLTLGNGFAAQPAWVQWYEYTGVFGGTLWIWLGNIAFYRVFFSPQGQFVLRPRWQSLAFTVGWLCLPVLYSYILYYNYDSQGTPTEVVALQPNIDPYTEKFVGSEKFIPYEEQVDRFIAQSEQELTPNTQFLLWPETAFDGLYYEPSFSSSEIFKKILAFKARHPDLALVTGMTSYIIYDDNELAPATARYREDIGYYDVFNTALFLGENNQEVFYHKSKLVPGVEILPYPQVFRVISETIFDLGGTAGGYGRQAERTVLFDADSVGAAPAICYESIYGDFLAEFARNGADMLFIITNDAWWGNTPGYKQHLEYASLRAIELRRSIARSANTGISAFINQRGDILHATEYWEPAVIRDTIYANEKLTFYAQHGDYLARTAVWLAPLVFLAALVKRKTYKY